MEAVSWIGNLPPSVGRAQLPLAAALVVGVLFAILTDKCSADEGLLHASVCELVTHPAGYTGKEIVVGGVADLDRPYALTDARCPDVHLYLNISFFVLTRESQIRVLMSALHRDDGIPHEREGIKAIFKGHYIADPSHFPAKEFILDSVQDMEEMARIPD